MLLNVTSILKFAQKMSKNKKSAQNFIILSHNIEHFKTNKFYY